MSDSTVKTEDSVKLLKECNAGVRMGIDSIDEVMPYVRSEALRKVLEDCRRTHAALFSECEKLLRDAQEEGKTPNPIAKGMSWMKTNVRIAFGESDSTIADLMTDGCNMGVKSLWRYRNQYQNADEETVKLAGKLIDSEEKLAAELRTFL